MGVKSYFDNVSSGALSLSHQYHASYMSLVESSQETYMKLYNSSSYGMETLTKRTTHYLVSGVSCQPR